MCTKGPGKYLKIRASSGGTQKARTKTVSLNSLFLSWASLASVHSLKSPPLSPEGPLAAGLLEVSTQLRRVKELQPLQPHLQIIV